MRYAVFSDLPSAHAIGRNGNNLPKRSDSGQLVERCDCGRRIQMEGAMR